MRRRALDSLAANYATLRIGHLWYLGVIALRLRDTAALASIQRIVESRADSSGARTDRLVAAEGSARLTLLRGDSAGAITQLQALKPTARRNGIAWLPWESLGAERMRADVGVVEYGNESKRAALSETVGGRVQVNVRTTHYIVPMSIGPQLT